MPAIHPREKNVKKAEQLLLDAIAAMNDLELTTVERLKVVNEVLCGEVSGILKCEIRYERHGNTDKPGGWA
jgi:hypothetical protein